MRSFIAVIHGDVGACVEAWPQSWSFRGDVESRVETQPGLSTGKLWASVCMPVLRCLWSGAEVGLSG